MKTAEELRQYLQDRLDNCGVNKSAPQLYNMVKSGDLLLDFCKFTDAQSGYKSADPNDPASKFPPPFPDKDGKYYHTVRDVTYQTFKSKFPKSTVDQFYNMTDEDRLVCIMWYINAGSITNSDVVNIMLSYCCWGTGNCNGEQVLYKSWYKKDIKTEDIDDKIFLDRVTDIRLYFQSTIKNYDIYGTGWNRGVLSMWKLLNQYL